jgi:hypothetical protein
MFGMMEALLSFIRRQVGLRTDAANAGGSLHAKMGDAKNLLNAVNANVGRAPWAAGKSPTWLYGKYTAPIPDNTIVTIVNITGPRIILGGHLIVSINRYCLGTLTVDDVPHTIQIDSSSYQGDGSFYGLDLAQLWQTYYATGLADYRFVSLTPASEYAYGMMATGGIITLPMMYINSSFKLEFQGVGAAGNAAYNILHTSV